MTNDTSAIIVCAGNSTRMGGVNKQFLPLGNSNVIGLSMSKFQRCSSVEEIIVVSKEEDVPTIKSIAKKLNISKLKEVVVGGNTRQESVFNGFRLTSESVELVTIHDGARPLVLVDDIERCIQDARIHGGATLAVPVKDTIKIVSKGYISQTPNRQFLYAIQTPQSFYRHLYHIAIKNALEKNLNCTDDCQLMENIGYNPFITVGHYSNIKITTPDDIIIAETILKGETLKYD
ncbi:MAG: 2-C-methyl-D-erythritol 4-phosphate cytidylyltransferase [Ruminococcus sp.]|nr:2-C-methyl-D-erythritol 4-phosphate cytidylyltransferase [Ruminococcus sp.]MCD7800115.1 2-C-methyl-D-erythritol 4-phosphate cytidylyltransferase [Ruminococcus sp.]